MASSEEKIYEIMWKQIYNYKPLRILILSVAILTMFNEIRYTFTPIYDYAKEKIEYSLSIKPEDHEIVMDKYSWWAGVFTFEKENHKNKDIMFAQIEENTNTKLLKCFEVLGFNDGRSSLPSAEAEYNILAKIKENQETREKFKGYLEKNTEANLPLFNVGYHLMATIDKLQEDNINRSSIQNHIIEISVNWDKAQRKLNYKLPEIDIYHNKNEYFILSRSELLENSISSLNTIRDFYGQI